MSVGSYEVSYHPPALAHRMARWSGARPKWRAAGGSNRGSGIRFFRTASPHTPYTSAFLGRPPRPQAPNLSIFWTGLPAGTPKIYPHRWTAFVRIFRGPIKPSTSARGALPHSLRHSRSFSPSPFFWSRRPRFFVLSARLRITGLSPPHSHSLTV